MVTALPTHWSVCLTRPLLKGRQATKSHTPPINPRTDQGGVPRACLVSTVNYLACVWPVVSPGSDVACLLPTSLGSDKAKGGSVEIVLLLGSQVLTPVSAQFT